jgi:UDP-N-acetylglucosamine:LPS N-acetylglucosamine transferase
MQQKNKKICLACSAGGHLRELQLAIGNIPNDYDCYWLTLKTTSTKAFLKDKEHVFLTNFQPAKKWTLLVNCIQAVFWVLVKRPDVIITTGAGVVVPTVFFAKKLLGTKVIFINSAADVVRASRTPVWIEKYADLFMVQWDDMLKIFPNAICCGVL